MALLIQPTFSRGEISPSLHGRVDTAAYAAALRTALNITVSTYGGFSNRAGLQFIAEVKDFSYAPRYIPFTFNADDKYVLEFGDFYMRVVRNDALVLEDAVNISGVTQASPGVVTATAHGYSDDDEVYIAAVAGMTELNGRMFIVDNATTDTFTLVDKYSGEAVDTSAYAAYSSGGTVARVYEITTIYAKEDLAELVYVQEGDVITFTHSSYPIQELARTDHDAWAFSEPTFAPEITFPEGLVGTAQGTAGSTVYRYKVTAIAEETQEESLAALNDTVKTITGATAANPVVLTVVGHGFSDGDEVYISGIVGMTELNGRSFFVANADTDDFELEGEDGTAYTAYVSGGSVAQTFVKITDGNATLSDTNYNELTWDAVADAQRYAVYKEDNGAFGLIGETEAETFKDENLEPDMSISPPRARNPFRGATNYPAALGYFEQRRVFGGSTRRPRTSYYSRTGSEENFTISSPQQSDDAITATLKGRQISPIRHYVPGSELLILTDNSEWRVNSGQDAAFEAATIKQLPQTAWGAGYQIPLVVGNTVLFVESNNARIRTLSYSLTDEKYVSTDLTLLAGHLFKRYTIVDWAAQHSPETIIYIVRSDGVVATLTFNQEQEVIAWTRWNTSGKFEQVVSLRRGSDGLDDNVYFVVRRIVGGRTVRYLEKLKPRRFYDVRDQFFVDSGLSLDSPVTITGITAADPVVVTAAAHGFSDGDEVDFSDIVWVPTFDGFDNETQPDQLNGGRFTVASATTDTFALQDEDGNDVDGSAFAAYVEGGYVRKAVNTISGLWHLRGREVAVLADGNVIEDLVVSDEGEITLQDKASRVHVGLKYIADAETLDIEVSAGPGRTIQGATKKIPRVFVRFEESRGALVGTGWETLQELKERRFEAYGEPTQLRTGIDEVRMEPKWDNQGRVCLRQRYPLPMTILAIVPDLSVGG